MRSRSGDEAGFGVLLVAVFASPVSIGDITRVSLSSFLRASTPKTRRNHRDASIGSTAHHPADRGVWGKMIEVSVSSSIRTLGVTTRPVRTSQRCVRVDESACSTLAAGASTGVL